MGSDRIGSDRMGWDGTQWDGWDGWDGMGWDGMGHLSLDMSMPPYITLTAHTLDTGSQARVEVARVTVERVPERVLVGLEVVAYMTVVGAVVGWVAQIVDECALVAHGWEGVALLASRRSCTVMVRQSTAHA